jgi:hypothetical protein
MIPKGVTELPPPPVGVGINEWEQFIKNTRKSRSGAFDNPDVLREEAINAELDASKRQESQAAGSGSGFEPGLDQPTPRWNPIVNQVFDPKTGQVVPTLPKPPSAIDSLTPLMKAKPKSIAPRAGEASAIPSTLEELLRKSIAKAKRSKK